MGKVIGGWKKAVLFNPDTGDVVQFNSLSNDGASWDPDIIRNETPTGQAFGGFNKPLAIAFFDTAGISQIESWNGVPLNAIVFSNGQHILFYEKEEFFFTLGDGIDTRDGAVPHLIDTEYHGEDPDIHQKKNLAEVITFTNDAGSLVFPLEGPTLTLAADYANLGTTDPTMTIEAKDYGTDGTDGTVLATSSKTVTAAGRVSVTITLPANTYLLSIDLVGGGSADVTNVSLRSDGKTAYITY